MPEIVYEPIISSQTIEAGKYTSTTYKCIFSMGVGRKLQELLYYYSITIFISDFRPKHSRNFLCYRIHIMIVPGLKIIFISYSLVLSKNKLFCYISKLIPHLVNSTLLCGPLRIRLSKFHYINLAVQKF